ncbi:MAG TPA: methyltransferase domain-containing protein [Thermoanaerobaculia bacterium]|nr:methyltransferase domain-containing protein [Thermoanaerobaculia bacterium]
MAEVSFSISTPATQTGKPAATEYVLSRGSEEYERLRRQAQIWEEATRRVFDRIPIEPGMRCLDVGCGPGETMRLLGERVGRDGEVAGLDSDGRLGAETLENLQQIGTTRFRFIESDVMARGLDFPERFDFVFTRMLLIHMPDPQAVVQRLVDWTKPGGWVVLQDYDLTGIKVFPSLERWPDFMNVLIGAFSGRGRDPSLGSKLPTLLRMAGIRAPILTDVTGKLTSLHEAKGMLCSTFQSLLPQAYASGLITEAAAARFLEEVEEQSRSDVPYSVSWPTLSAAWAQRAG